MFKILVALINRAMKVSDEDQDGARVLHTCQAARPIVRRLVFPAHTLASLTVSDGFLRAFAGRVFDGVDILVSFATGSFASCPAARPANLITDLAIAQVPRPLREAF